MKKTAQKVNYFNDIIFFNILNKKNKHQSSLVRTFFHTPHNGIIIL